MGSVILNLKEEDNLYTLHKQKSVLAHTYTHTYTPRERDEKREQEREVGCKSKGEGREYGVVRGKKKERAGLHVGPNRRDPWDGYLGPFSPFTLF